ncbi:archaetidylserine decarboxylase [Mechercharimyces sp. CAU 1602]|uniref:archaetidylserine decarboxylase n=1 Tax=Mechercharimyces sp. CAU 1602 TaxID=2973933 RepID=UPI0021629228|nr:archaetidylserine decarboxylase [Mechercharimyces sp. CAU 1602]MCS1350200.1 archaetidylserine decarboxylase [Mechercharimyces sp. CAU 1602]
MREQMLRGISRLTGRLARSPWSKPLIPLYIRYFKIDLDPIEKPVAHYPSLLDFFVRGLKPEARPIDKHAHSVVSPVDGVVAQAGNIRDGLLIQAKGVTYSLATLLADEDEARRYEGGHFVTVYLSPRDYHRIHTPLAARVTDITYIPGALYPVNSWGVKKVPGLFNKNERLITHMATAIGKVALVKVGATNVGSIQLAFDDRIEERQKREIKHKVYQPPIPLAKGEELGRFEFGSTIILLLPPEGVARWEERISSGQSVRMGEKIATILS